MKSYEALRVFLDGMLFMMALYSVLCFLQQRKAIYWQYALYIACITTTFYLNDLDYKNEIYLTGTSFPITFLESLSFVLYISFAVKLIGIKENDPLSYRILRGMVVLLFIETLVDIFLFLFDTSDATKSASYTLFRFVLAAGGLLVALRILKVRQPVISYFITGSLLFVLGCTAALLASHTMTLFTRSPDSPFSYPVTYMQLGVVGEVLCFTLGMSLRNRENEREKIRVQAQLIEQLRENDSKNQKLLQIRDDIAQDLHDELGADLASISMVSHAAISQLSHRPDQARESLKQIGETSRKVIKLLREIVWSLHSAHDTEEQYVTRLRDTAQSLFEHHPTALHFHAEEAGFFIPSSVRRDLFLIYKELLHNALRHADARNVRINLRATSQGLFLQVEDDGHGFDLSTSSNGYGLPSLQRRALSLNGHLSVASSSLNGTKVIFTCSLAEAEGSAL